MWSEFSPATNSLAYSQTIKLEAKKFYKISKFHCKIDQHFLKIINGLTWDYSLKTCFLSNNDGEQSKLVCLSLASLVKPIKYILARPGDLSLSGAQVDTPLG
jgi:hypothetical protein